MKYDDASWHVGGDFPKELPPEAGATHIGMFAAWCMLNGLTRSFTRKNSKAICSVCGSVKSLLALGLLLFVTGSLSTKT